MIELRAPADGVRWYVAYPISYRQLEEMMEEHGVEVDHATLNRWVLICSAIGSGVSSAQAPGGFQLANGRDLCEGQRCLAVNKATRPAPRSISYSPPKRDRKAALRFLRKAIKWNGTPETITIDRSGANTAAIESHNGARKTGIEIRQVKYLNNVVEQDHRAIKRRVRPMLGFKSFRSAAVTLAGIERMHMIQRGQLQTTGEVCSARQFYSLAR